MTAPPLTPRMPHRRDAEALPEAAEQLARLLTLALNLTDPRGDAARCKCRMDGWYSTLPGMPMFNRLLARMGDVDERQRQRIWTAASDLAAAVVSGVAVIEDGITQAERASR